MSFSDIAAGKSVSASRSQAQAFNPPSNGKNGGENSINSTVLIRIAISHPVINKG